MDKFIIILIVSMLIMPAAAVLAHGEEELNDHFPTQIGADNSFRFDASEKLSREEVSLSVSPALRQEDTRASIKFIILVLLLYVVCWLFFPKTASLPQKDELAAANVQAGQPPST